MQDIFEHLAYFMNGAAAMLFLLFAIHFLRQRRENRLKRILGWVMTLWFALLAKDILCMFDSVRHSGYIYRLLLTVDMLAVPSCGVFAIELLRPGWQRAPRMAAHFSVFALICIAYAVTGNKYVYLADMALAILYCAIVFIYLLRQAARYNRMVHDNYSDIDNIDLHWLWHAVAIMLVCFACWIYEYFYVSFVADFFYYLSICAVWGVICHYTDRQKVIDREVTESPVMEAGPDPAAGCIPRTEPEYHFSAALEQLEADGYFCRTPGLTLTALAAKLHTNRTTLSHYINTVLGYSFYDYINSLRLTHAKKLLSDSRCSLTQEEIAEQSGFNSISTFRRAFAKQYGMSPAEYRRRTS